MTNYSDIITQASNTYGVSSGLISAVINEESGGNPNALSSTGAMGLMQLEPGTAGDLGVTNPFDPTQNIFGGTSYLSQLINEFGGDISSALAAYNWGPANVKSGNPTPTSVQQYVSNVMANANLSPSLDLSASAIDSSGISNFGTSSGDSGVILIGGLAIAGLIVWWLL